MGMKKLLEYVGNVPFSFGGRVGWRHVVIAMPINLSLWLGVLWCAVRVVRHAWVGQ